MVPDMGRCPECSHVFALTAYGKLVRHLHDGRTWCEGSYQAPAGSRGSLPDLREEGK